MPDEAACGLLLLDTSEMHAGLPIRLASTTAKTPNNEELPSDDGTGDAATSVIAITIYIFRGQPDTYYNRHVLAYFTSPDLPDFHETVHAQRETERSPWIPKQESGKIDWLLIVNYLDQVNAGAVEVPRGEEMALVRLVASADVRGRETDSGWNCQHYLLEGMQKLVDAHYQTQEWYDAVQEELTDRLLDGAVP